MDDLVHGQESIIMPNIAMGVLRQRKSWRQLFVYLQELPSQLHWISNRWVQFSCDVDFEVLLNLSSVSMHLA